MAYDYHTMTYTPLEREDGTELSVRVKTHLRHAQEDLTEECPESPNKPPTDGGVFRHHRGQRPVATTTGTLSRQSGLVEVRAWSSALVQSKLAMIPKAVGLVVFEQMTAADLTGPAEAFSRAKPPINDKGGLRCYQLLTLGVGAAACATECGIIVKPRLEIRDAPPLDTIIVSGGSGIHDARLSKKIANWLSRRALATRRIATLGSGIYALAATGLLDGRQVTTHWRFARDVALRFPKLRINPNCLFVKDGPFYTCAGGAAAIDLSLSLIEEDYGRQVALALARELVVHLKRSGEEQQYSEPLQFQVESSDRFANLPAWILCNLNQNLSVESLAQKACMSPRNFARLFKHSFGVTPAEFVARARIREAQRRLRVPRNSIGNVGASVGFKSADAFSRTFERLAGIRPSTYRGLRVVPADNFQSPEKLSGYSDLWRAPNGVP